MLTTTTTTTTTMCELSSATEEVRGETAHKTLRQRMHAHGFVILRCMQPRGNDDDDRHDDDDDDSGLYEFVFQAFNLRFELLCIRCRHTGRW